MWHWLLAETIQRNVWLKVLLPGSDNCNRISLGPGGWPVFVQDPALFTGLFTARVRNQNLGGGGVVTLWLKDVQRDFHLTVGPVTRRRVYPIITHSPLIVRYRTKWPAALPRMSPPPVTTPRSEQGAISSHLTWPGGHPPLITIGARLTNGRDRSQKVKVEKWQMSHKTSHNSQSQS